MVDEPQEKVFGGLVAAPAFRTIMETILRERGIFPQETEAMRKKVLAQKKVGKTLKKKETSLTLPARGQHDASQIEMPDLQVLTLKEALKYLTQRGVTQVEGRGVSPYNVLKRVVY